MRRRSEHAVVVGGSVSGLLAARVLSDHFEHVTVVERDTGDGVNARRGVPQGAHPHTLLFKTSMLLEGLFPGLGNELVEAGALRVGWLTQCRMNFHGHKLHQSDIGLTSLCATRPFIEHVIRGRVAAIGNVEFKMGWDAVDLRTTGGGESITGITVRAQDTGNGCVLPADLVIDASGRSPRSQVWLKKLGYPRPREDQVSIGLAYVSQLVRMDLDSIDGDRVLATLARPTCPRGMYLFAQEDGKWMLTMYGYGEHRPSRENFLDEVLEFAPPDVRAAVQTAEFLGEPQVHQIPKVFRRRYEELGAFPHGLLVVGDALSTMNPVYGTGMMCSAVQAVLLQRELAFGFSPGLERRFFGHAARAIVAPWTLSVLADSGMPGVQGAKIPGAALANGYLRQLAAGAERDPLLAATLVGVLGNVKSPAELARPSVLWRVFLAGFSRLRQRKEQKWATRNGRAVSMQRSRS
ncbi:FAD-dependent oxidoreductase [Amycolatopsis sp. cg5]|uniref:FAD-dependent oxidoreductase n=1 Tax=Amycolatopsis sp. cg5 TaxID=3238802 RepID=UPI00352359CC